MSTTSQAAPMTVGELSRRTGVPIKNLRHYTDWGLIYTMGRTTELQQTLRRIDEFEATRRRELAGYGACWRGDPRCATSA